MRQGHRRGTGGPGSAAASGCSAFCLPVEHSGACGCGKSGGGEGGWGSHETQLGISQSEMYENSGVSKSLEYEVCFRTLYLVLILGDPGATAAPTATCFKKTKKNPFKNPIKPPKNPKNPPKKPQKKPRTPSPYHKQPHLHQPPPFLRLSQLVLGRPDSPLLPSLLAAQNLPFPQRLAQTGGVAEKEAQGRRLG